MIDNKKMSSNSGPSPSKGNFVCLLDDDSSVLKSMSRLLVSAGWPVQPFLDPHSFLTYAQNNQPRLLVLDMSMPLMHGLEVQERLRQVSHHTQVIVVTAMDDPGLRSRATGLGASRFFVKPVEEEELLSGVDLLMRDESNAQAT